MTILMEEHSCLTCIHFWMGDDHCYCEKNKYKTGERIILKHIRRDKPMCNDYVEQKQNMWCPQ